MHFPPSQADFTRGRTYHGFEVQSIWAVEDHTLDGKGLGQILCGLGLSSPCTIRIVRCYTRGKWAQSEEVHVNFTLFLGVKSESDPTPENADHGKAIQVHVPNWREKYVIDNTAKQIKVWDSIFTVGHERLAPAWSSFGGIGNYALIQHINIQVFPPAGIYTRVYTRSLFDE